MNPKEFNWTADQQVTVTNPTAEDFIFKVHSKDYAVGAGKTAKMPGYIAWVYTYSLAVKMSQAAGEFNRWNEEGFRKNYYEKVVVGADPTVEEVIATNPEIETFDQETVITTKPLDESSIKPMTPKKVK